MRRESDGDTRIVARVPRFKVQYRLKRTVQQQANENGDDWLVVERENVL